MNNLNSKYGIYDFIFDTLDDFKGTPHSAVKAGSTAFIIETSTWYMLNNTGNWVEVTLSSSEE